MLQRLIGVALLAPRVIYLLLVRCMTPPVWAPTSRTTCHLRALVRLRVDWLLLAVVIALVSGRRPGDKKRATR